MIHFYSKKNIPKYFELINTSHVNKSNPIYLSAKKNYILYHNKDPETVYFSDIEKSSAGIEGWACAGPYRAVNGEVTLDLSV